MPTWFGIPNFYPRSPCGERPMQDIPTDLWQIISIHALLAESDPDAMPLTTSPLPFLSTLSLRRATSNRKTNVRNSLYFYPRSPCGERRMRRCTVACSCRFLSTLSLRRATEYWVGGYGTANNFYPRSPCGERLDAPIRVLGKARISIHALLAESDH